MQTQASQAAIAEFRNKLLKGSDGNLKTAFVNAMSQGLTYDEIVKVRQKFTYLTITYKMESYNDYVRGVREE